MVVDGRNLSLLPETAGLRRVRHHICRYALWSPEFAQLWLLGRIGSSRQVFFAYHAMQL